MRDFGNLFIIDALWLASMNFLLGPGLQTETSKLNQYKIMGLGRTVASTSHSKALRLKNCKFFSVRQNISMD